MTTPSTSCCCCHIVPPHLLRAIANSEEVSETTRQAAKASLESRDKYSSKRKELFDRLTRPRGYRTPQGSPSASRRRSIIPDTLLRHLAHSSHLDDEGRARAKRDLDHLTQVLQGVGTAHTSEQVPLADGQKNEVKDRASRAVYDAENNFDEYELPGKLVRSEGEPNTGDEAVDEAYKNIGTVLDLYKEHFNWMSIDNESADVISTVHFGENYENAFWDPERRQMVFGDGDEFLNNFTGCIDVIGHELTHAVTEHTAPLNYWGMSGALNEHISDVFGIMVKQKVQNETAADADWLIGEDCIMPGAKGTALRSMKAPGTAYNDARFGKDPQVGHMKSWYIMADDNGGVHIFSGIPNKAFQLAAVSLGGYSWEKAGQIWWKTMNSGRIPPNCTFRQFADVTIEVAEDFGRDAPAKVKKAWAAVGVMDKVRRAPGRCTGL
ncbi:uncharacterized protein F5Z01DRAFT_493474 [Emericellopsis atlantica]|uniref:Uncharacterized protein n=1 Tax=Emericellopsis atlantica TaxID=2614577 RepID=A0A9P8CTK3_9HYPO|nr:uncharacterized protein F5Z01DRAFT_493474 [Emericellopsis atlantica]KAG9256921.1 hypothetical protein F5Z01DRAFT_493474 [Emericellopsis atlantica]